MASRSLKDRKIALIGGAGFIGHHLALALAKQGAHVEIIDGLEVNNLLEFTSMSTNQPYNALYCHFLNERLRLLRDASIPLHVQDARDYHRVAHLLEAIDPSVVIHLAAIAHAGKSNKDPYHTFDHSLRTLENVLDFSRGQQIDQFVYFSSSMVYGTFGSDTVTEETVCNPLGIYGALKFSGEKLVIAYNQTFDLPYTIIRPSALYGERCVSRRVAQIFVENAIRGDEIVVNGDGSDALDFTYIDDLVQGIVKVVSNDNAINETFNLTFGGSRTIKQLADIVSANFPDIKVKFKARDKLTPKRGTLSVDKAKSLLGYSPKYPLEEGCVKYLNWYKSHSQDLPSIQGHYAATL